MMWYDYVFGALLIAIFGFTALLIVLVGMNEREDDGEDKDSRHIGQNGA